MDGGGGGGWATSREKEGGTVCSYNSKIKTRTIDLRCAQYLEIISVLPFVCILLTSVVDPDPDPSPSPHQIEM